MAACLQLIRTLQLSIFIHQTSSWVRGAPTDSSSAGVRKFDVIVKSSLQDVGILLSNPSQVDILPMLKQGINQIDLTDPIVLTVCSKSPQTFGHEMVISWPPAPRKDTMAVPSTLTGFLTVLTLSLQNASWAAYIRLLILLLRLLCLLIDADVLHCCPIRCENAAICSVFNRSCYAKE